MGQPKTTEELLLFREDWGSEQTGRSGPHHTHLKTLATLTTANQHTLKLKHHFNASVLLVDQKISGLYQRWREKYNTESLTFFLKLQRETYWPSPTQMLLPLPSLALLISSKFCLIWKSCGEHWRQLDFAHWWVLCEYSNQKINNWNKTLISSFRFWKSSESCKQIYNPI